MKSVCIECGKALVEGDEGPFYVIFSVWEIRAGRTLRPYVLALPWAILLREWDTRSPAESKERADVLFVSN